MRFLSFPNLLSGRASRILESALTLNTGVSVLAVRFLYGCLILRRLRAGAQPVEDRAVGVKDSAGAVRQLLALIDIDRHYLRHYVDVERRLRDDVELAERAATAIVEAAPNEAEYHEALAKIRTARKQHAAAVVHWRQVAELRSLEPNGLINLAKAQLKADQRQAADMTIAKIQKTEWPSRFAREVDTAIKELTPSK